MGVPSKRGAAAARWPDMPDDWAKVFPLLDTLRTYHLKTLQADIIGGCTVFFTLVPQSLAYAKLVGVPSVWGLYAAAFPLLLYAVFGSSKHICTGPFAVTCYMLGDICSDYLEFFEKGSLNYIKFSLYVTFISGLMFMVMWALKLGFLVNMVTPSVNSGFITGCAMLVWFHQVPNAFGFTVPHTPMTSQSFGELFKAAKKTTSVAMCITIPTYIFLYGVTRYKRARGLIKNKNPTGWYNFVTFMLNTAYFIAFICGYALSRSLQANHPDSHAVKTLLLVGEVPPGIQPSVFGLPTFLPLTDALEAIPPALTLTIVAGMTNWSITKKFADEFGYSANIQNELFSSGIVNIFGPLTNSFFSAGGLARTAIGVESGSQTQVSNIICAILVLVSLISFAPELKYIPLPTLGTITMCGVMGMIDFQKQIATYKKDKKEAAVMLVTTLCTFWLGVTQGIIVGILISLLSELYSNYYPRIIPLGVRMLPRQAEGCRLEYIMGGRALPHIAIARVDASSLYFGNVQYICGHLIHIARRGHENEHKAPIATAAHFVLGHRVLIVDIASCDHLDETASTCLKEMRKALLLRDTYVAYVQGESFYDIVREEGDEEGGGSEKRRSASGRGGGSGSREGSPGKSIRDSILSAYKGAAVTTDTTHFSTAPHVQGQLAVCGASKESKNGTPITIFGSIDEAVRYFTIFFSVKAACDLTDPVEKETRIIGHSADQGSSSGDSGAPSPPHETAFQKGECDSPMHAPQRVL